MILLKALLVLVKSNGMDDKGLWIEITRASHHKSSRKENYFRNDESRNFFWFIFVGFLRFCKFIFDDFEVDTKSMTAPNLILVIFYSSTINLDFYQTL
jgi:hypothetical protein